MNDFQRYSLILKRRWLVIVTVSISVFGLSALNAFKQKPSYEAEGKLLFNKTDRVSVLTSPSQQVGEFSGVTQLSNPLYTKTEIIRSYPIAEKTVKNLKLTRQRGKLLEINEFLGKLKVKTVRGTDILSIAYSSNNSQEAAAVVNSVIKYYLENNIRINQTQVMAAHKFLSKQRLEAEARVLVFKTIACWRRFEFLFAQCFDKVLLTSPMPSNLEDRDSIELQQYWRILKKRWLVTASVIPSVLIVTAFLTFQQKSIYEAEGKLLFSKINRVSSLTSLSTQVGELSGVTQASNPMDTEAEVIRSNRIVQKTIDNLKLQNQQGEPLEIDELLKELKVKSVRGTDVLVVQYRSSNPQNAAKVVNSLMNYYLENNVQTNRAEATAARQFLLKQLPGMELKVAEAENGLRLFKQANKVVSLGDEAKEGVESLKDLSEQITKTEADLADANSRSVGLQSQLKLSTQQAVNQSEISQSTGVQQVLTEYQKVQDELAVQRTRLTEEHPTIQNLLRKQAALSQQLKLRVEESIGQSQAIEGQNLQLGSLKQNLTTDLVKSDVEKLALTNRLSVLKNAYVNYQNRLSVLPQLEQKQRQLERQLEVARFTYEQLLKRLQEVNVEVNQNVGNVRVVSEALVPKQAVSPKRAFNLALGGLAGIFLSVGISLILDALDKSLKTVEQAKELFGYPLLGKIPSLSAKATPHVDLPYRDNPHLSVSAAFEILQANLDFSIEDKMLKVIVVASSSPNEGKSFVAANLALANAHMGRRVLLIDADMRHPRQQEIWQLPGQIGLSNVLVGQVDLAIATKQVLVNLEVLGTGTIPSNPVALVDGDRMTDLIKLVTREYNLVIIDTPALNLFADGLMLNRLTDGMLLVVRPSALDLTTAQTTKSMLQQSQTRVLGMVINDVAVEKGNGTYYASKYYENITQGNTKIDNSKLPAF